jgi:hypothetical protein
MRKRVSALENQVAVLQKQEQRARADGSPAPRAIAAAGTSG